MGAPKFFFGFGFAGKNWTNCPTSQLRSRIPPSRQATLAVGPLPMTYRAHHKIGRARTITPGPEIVVLTKGSGCQRRVAGLVFAAASLEERPSAIWPQLAVRASTYGQCRSLGKRCLCASQRQWTRTSRDGFRYRAGRLGSTSRLNYERAGTALGLTLMTPTRWPSRQRPS